MSIKRARVKGTCAVIAAYFFAEHKIVFILQCQFSNEDAPFTT